MSENRRTAAQAAIKRATKAAQTDMDRLDARARKEVTALYRQAADDLRRRIAAHAGPDDNLGLNELQNVLAQVNARLGDLTIARDEALHRGLKQSADLGIRPFATDASLESLAAMQISDEALQFVRTFVAADGLQLSDRIWRLDRHARESVTNAIEQAVIEGHGAAQAAREFLSKGESIPDGIQGKLHAANAPRIGSAAAELLTGTGSPMDNAMRLFRTELNRAHGTAYMRGAEGHPDAAGTRFLLSPGHPKPDICDLHATANLHGLGPGVYPPGANPWPAHPNTLSYVEIVFKDEVTQADQEGKETPIAALERMTPAQRIGILGKNKANAFVDGLITRGMIKAPWKSVKKRIAKDLPEAPLKRAPHITLDRMIAVGKTKADQLLAAVVDDDSNDFGPNFVAALHKELNAVRSTTTAAKLASGGKGAELVAAASRLFPDDWTKEADQYGRLFAKFSTARAFQVTIGKSDRAGRHRLKAFGVIAAEPGDGYITAGSFSTAVHEYTHRLQHALPAIDDFFQELHGRRTEGAPLRRLRDLQPGYRYGRDEVTREDGYVDPYQGREYSGYGMSYLGKHGALEVMTMAFEDVLAGNPFRLRRLIRDDREMMDLAIGLLFDYVP